MQKLFRGSLVQAIEHLDRLRGGTGLLAGSAGHFLRNEVGGHLAKLGHSLSLAAAGSKSHCRDNGKDESGEFHKRIWLDDSDVYSSKFAQNSQYKFYQSNTFWAIPGKGQH